MARAGVPYKIVNRKIGNQTKNYSKVLSMMNPVLSKTSACLIFLGLLGSQSQASEIAKADKSLLEIINNSKNCQIITSAKSCTYQVGDYFKVAIAAIGTAATGVHFEKSDRDMPVYASFGTSHGCIIVNKFETSEFVFISPKNGMIYKSWQDCGSAR